MWELIPYPEDFKTFEDLAIAKRILYAGWKIVYEPTAPVYHSQLVSKQVSRRKRGTKSGLQTTMSQNLAKSAGLFPGLHERFLPLHLKRYLSSYRVYDTSGRN